MINIGEYYLDIDKVFKLDKEKSDLIINFYNRMVEYCNMGTTNGVYLTMFNTLIKSGYLKNKNEEEREEKIDLING